MLLEEKPPRFRCWQQSVKEVVPVTRQESAAAELTSFDWGIWGETHLSVGEMAPPQNGPD